MEDQIRQSNRELIAMSRLPTLSPRESYMESRHLSKETQELLQKLTASAANNYTSAQISPVSVATQRLPPFGERPGMNLSSPSIGIGGSDLFSPRSELSQTENRGSRPAPALVPRSNIQMISPSTPQHSPVLGPGHGQEGASLRNSQDINQLSMEIALRNSSLAQNNIPLMSQMGVHQQQEQLGIQSGAANTGLSRAGSSNHAFIPGSNNVDAAQQASVPNSIHNNYINQLLLPQILAAQTLNSTNGILSSNVPPPPLPALLPGNTLGGNTNNQPLLQSNLSPSAVINPLLLNPTLAAVLMQQNSLLLPALIAHQNAKTLSPPINGTPCSSSTSGNLNQSNVVKLRSLDAAQYETIKPILPEIPESKPTALPQPSLAASSSMLGNLGHPVDKTEASRGSIPKKSPPNCVPTGLLMPVPMATSSLGRTPSFDSTIEPLDTNSNKNAFDLSDSITGRQQKSEKETLVEIIQKNIMGQLNTNSPRKHKDLVFPGRSSSTPSAQQGPPGDSTSAKKRASLQLETRPALNEDPRNSPKSEKRNNNGKLTRKRRHPLRETVSASDIFNDESSRSGNSSPSVGSGSANSSSPLVNQPGSDSSRGETPSSSLLSALASYNEQRVCQLLHPGGMGSNGGSTTPSKHVNLKKSWAVQYQQQEEVPAIMPDGMHNGSSNGHPIEDPNSLEAKKMRLGVPSGNPATPSMTPPQKPSGRKSSKETISVSDIFSSKKPGDNAYQKLLESSSSPDSSSGHPKPPEIPGAYLQIDTCSVITPKPNLMCRDCRARGTGIGSNPHSSSSGSNSSNSSGNDIRCNSVGKLYCRFVSFRKLKNSKNKYPSVVGFLDASKDSSERDVKMWKTLRSSYKSFGTKELVVGISAKNRVPLSKGSQGSHAPHKALFRLAQIGTALCQIIHQEQRVQRLYKDSLYWKRFVGGCREVCDVCCTSLFNFHWLCPKCGFVTCLDCYDCYVESKLEIGILGTLETQQDCHGRVWLKCTKAPHAREALKLTQFIPQKCMDELLCILHSECKRWNIPHNCHLMEPDNHFSSIVSHPNMSELLHSQLPKKSPSPLCGVSSTSSPSPPLHSPQKLVSRHQTSQNPNPDFFTNSETHCTVSVNQSGLKCEQNSVDSENLENSKKGAIICSRDSKPDQCQVSSSSFPELASGSRCFPGTTQETLETTKRAPSFNVIIDRLVESSFSPEKDKFSEKLSKTEFLKFESLNSYMTIKPLTNFEMGIEGFGCSEDDTKPSTSIKTSAISKKLEWLLANCSYVSNSSHVLSLNYRDITEKETALFSAQWRLNKPVIVRGCGKNNETLKKFFSPEYLMEKFGDWKVDLIDCRTGRVHPMMLMNKFLQGFFDVIQRKHNFGQLSNGCDIPTVLKLKDFPPGNDFIDVMPVESFNSLMDSLPLWDYTKRNEGGGAFNLACSLPPFCCAPDMGPKMFIAYGSPGEPNVSSTNLHIDMSDAVNILLHVSTASTNQKSPEQSGKANGSTSPRNLRKGFSMEEEVRHFGGEEALDRLRKGEKPGAVWNIFNTDDNKVLRKFLRNEAEMMHKAYRTDDDPIHDQEIFLGPEKLKKLKNEEGIEPYTFMQFENDCVFIPAGAAHQVRNLNSCIKAAVDFVSPERVRHCLKTTDEFRNLSDKHSNHEDKLQIKSVIYHAVKDSLSISRFYNSN